MKFSLYKLEKTYLKKTLTLTMSDIKSYNFAKAV